jgi:hypothetical protein
LLRYTKVTSERVAAAAVALRGAEARAEARRIELDTLRALVGNGTSAYFSRARTIVAGAGESAAAARAAAERLFTGRLRAEEEARTQAETRAEVRRCRLTLSNPS